jgi:hypothetical protein
MLGLETLGFERVVKASLGVPHENASCLSHHLDFYPPLRSCHLPDPCVRRCVHAEPFSCLNRASGCSCDLGDHTGTVLDSSIIQGKIPRDSLEIMSIRHTQHGIVCPLTALTFRFYFPGRVAD